MPIAVLILIPVAIFAGAALITGHPLLIGDNLIQNYPLRTLVGADLRHGTLPLWDPWIWTGTPLMAGLNAGAFYPATLLFAVLPAATAWVVGQILVVSSISVGTYVFMRATGLGPLPSFLGAASFAFAGAAAGQGSVHLDMSEGFASLPWLLLAIRRIIDDGRWRWSLLLGAAYACLILSGAPEAILDVTVLSLTYAVMRWSVRPNLWGRLLSRAGVGLTVGIGLSALLWLPALRFIGTSQRSAVTTVFASSYSFPPRALVLGLIPFLDGGWGLVSQPTYFGQSNLPEVAFYVGLLPVVAVIALISPRWKGWLPPGERRTWYVIGFVGLLLAIGAGTPLEHVLSHVPLYGKQRDQGRNIVDVDFAACVLLAWWVDGGRRPERSRSVFEIIAVVGVLGALVTALAWLLARPATLWQAVGAFAPTKTQLGSIETAAAISALLGLGAAVLVLARPRLNRAVWLRVTTGFVLLDVALFASGTSFTGSHTVPSARDPGPLFQLVKANLSHGGRYAVYDPQLFYPAEIVQAGEANVGILADLPSVQGYGAILDGKYAHYTSTHGRGYLNLRALRRGYFGPLGLQVMLAPAEEFLIPIAAIPSGGTPSHLTLLKEGAGVDPLLPAGNTTPPQQNLPPLVPSGDRPAIRSGHSSGWFFGTAASPLDATLLLGSKDAGQLIRVGQITSSGSTIWQPEQRLGAGSSAVALQLAAMPTTGIVVQLTSGDRLGPLQLTIRAAGRTYLVEGPLPSAMTPASWTYVGEADHFAVFRTNAAPQQAWVQRLGTDAYATHVPSSVRILSQSTNSETIAVHSPLRSILVRSSAWDAGWRAEIVSGTAASRDLVPAGSSAGGALAAAANAAVQSVGVLQGVDIPAGLSLVRFYYEGDGFSSGLTITAATLAGTVLGAILVVGLSRRKRRSPAALPPD